MCDKVETVKGFCYLGDRLNASGGCEAAVTARTRVGRKKFRECGDSVRKKILFVDERDGHRQFATNSFPPTICHKRFAT